MEGKLSTLVFKAFSCAMLSPGATSVALTCTGRNARIAVSATNEAADFKDLPLECLFASSETTT